MRYSTTLRVRYAETDAMGIVYHANYLVWFEVARGDMFRAMGVGYGKVEETGILLPVVASSVRYLRPARYDDNVRVETWISRLSPARLELSYTVDLDETILATGSTEHAFVDTMMKPFNCRKRHPELWEMLSKAFSGQ